ncbi:MAG: Hsp33 family molecular chaperone [Xanthobacteraceae bacterium]|nr:Hsp33 family molecular chaperone [Xanthobacteraceae bacterium]MCW5673629.1 Hsp33 family molecular chaperone [Xanthobacteraceae bacterium]
MSAQEAARLPTQHADDDKVLPFQVDPLDVRGRVVRLGTALDKAIENHNYPAPVARALSEAITLAVLLGSTLKDAGRLILQTQTDGPIDFMVVDVVAPEKVRAYARFNRKRLAAAGKATTGELLGNGHLAMTVETGAANQRYQGIVALNGASLEEAAHTYFQNSEQIPTRARIAVGEEMLAGEKMRWRAGGILVQFLPKESARAQQGDIDPGDAPEGTPKHEVKEDDAWIEAKSLVETVEDHELLDSSLSSERLLWRLFNERGVRVFDALPVEAHCSCTRDRVYDMLKSFTPEDRASMVKDGKITVTCEFCGRVYPFEPDEVEAETK